MNRLLLAAVAGGLVACSSGTIAETLRDALVSTYQTNPTLNAQREALRATDATVAIARAEGRPQVGATAGLTRDTSQSGVLDTSRVTGPAASGGIDLDLPLFRGGRVRNSVAAARARVEAGRGTLRAVEGDVFTDAVAAYMDVIRDQAVLELNENQVDVLTTHLQATTKLFNSGDLTRTDIAQSEARLSGARADLLLARSRLATSEERYRQIVGRSPEGLAPPPPLPSLPSNAEEVVRIALRHNPNIAAATQQARAAALDVEVARADRLPSVSGVVSGDYVNNLRRDSNVGLRPNGAQTSVGLTTRIPLYQGGAPMGRIRQARALEGQLLEQTIAAERAVVAQARSAFANYQASQGAIKANQVAIAANELALRGMRAERRVGTRTVIEVLNAEQELLNSQVELVSSKRNAYVAGFELLNVMGQAESSELGLESGPLYDPLKNYRQIAGSWSDWGKEGRHQVRSHASVPQDKAPARTPVMASKKAPGGPVASTAAPTLAAPAPKTPGPAPKVVTAMARAPVPSAAAVDGAKTGWAIQLGAFRTAGAPQALYARMESKLEGKQPVYHAVGKLTRLLVGPYASRLDAAAACRRIGSSNGCMIVPFK